LTSSSDTTFAPVHVVVLAAGRGSRLGALGGETPKWLLRVGTRTIAERHLGAVDLAGRAVASVSVVIGHAGAAIEQAVAAAVSPPVRVIPNPEFAELNNWWSLLRALRELPGDGPVAVINSDLLADEEHVAAFLRSAAHGDADALIAVDLERELTDESMKVARDESGHLGRIGKVDIPAPVGEYIGLLMARGAALAALRDELERFVGKPESANEWYEGAVGRSAAAGTPWTIWPMPSTGWVEIDDDDDFDAAQALVGAA
jgi:choline kinase